MTEDKRREHSDCKECFREWLKADRKPLEETNG